MLSTFIEFILFYLAIGCNFFLQPWEDNFDFLLFCLVKLLFPGSYWAERISTVFSLNQPVLWGRAYPARNTVCSVTMLLWEQSPSVWTVVKVSLAQPEGGEREARKAMGHLCTSQSLEMRNSPKTIWEACDTYTSMCCAMMALLLLVSSQHFFSLFSLYWSRSCKSLHQTLWTGDTITAIPTSQLPNMVGYL